jgi:hypothetical protein
MNLLLAAAILPAHEAEAAGFCIRRKNLVDANDNNFTIWGVSRAYAGYPNETNSFARVGYLNTTEPGDSFFRSHRDFVQGLGSWDTVQQRCRSGELNCS